MWIFGADKIWEEMHRGAQLRAPRFFYYTAKYLTPLLLLVVLVGFAFQPFLGAITGKTIEGVSMQNLPVVWVARALLIALLVIQCWLVHSASKKWGNQKALEVREGQ